MMKYRPAVTLVIFLVLVAIISLACANEPQVANVASATASETMVPISISSTALATGSATLL